MEVIWIVNKSPRRPLVLLSITLTLADSSRAMLIARLLMDFDGILSMQGGVMGHDMLDADLREL